MSIVAEVFRRLEEEQKLPVAALRCVIRMVPPADLGRRTMHAYTQACGTVQQMDALLRRKAKDYGAKVRRRRGRLRFDVYYPMAFEKISYFVVRIEW